MRDLTNNTEKSLLNLATLQGIASKYGWKIKLAEWLECKSNILSTWINRDSIPKKQRDKIKAKGYPEEEWYITEESPDIEGPIAEGTHVVRVHDPEIADLLIMTKEVLESQTSFADSLAANVRSFHESVEMKKKLSRIENDTSLTKEKEDKAPSDLEDYLEEREEVSVVEEDDVQKKIP